MSNKEKKPLIFSIIAAIVIVTVSVFLYVQRQEKTEVGAAGEGWLANWSRRKSVTVTNSNTGLAGTVNGNPTLGATGKFGTAVSFDGSGDYVSFADSSDWDFGTGDFTIDFWANRSNTGMMSLFEQRSDDSNRMIMYYNSSYNGLIFLYQIGGAIRIYVHTSTAISTGWHHFAVVRSGSNFNIYVDGVSQTLTWDSGSAGSDLSGISAPLSLGLTNSVADFSGYMDEFRISKGVARWTSNFTPPTAAYSSDAYTKLLLHLNETSGTSVYSDPTLINYQASLTVSYDNDMQPDFDDLRFTSSDGSTLLDYWLESKTDSSTAKVWVEIPSLASGSNTIYMYYGNSNVSSVSSGANTFRHFDNFSSSTNWNFLSGASISGNELTINVYNPGWSWPMATYKTPISVPYVLMYEGYMINGAQSATRFSDAVGMTTYSSTDPQSVGVGYLDYNRLYGDYSTGVYSSLSLSTGVWYKVDHAVTANSSKITVSGVSSQTSIAHSTGRYAGLGMAHQNSKYRNFAIREYAATEPTNSFGSEEIATGGDNSCVSTASVRCSQNVIDSYAINMYTLLGSSTGTATWTPPAGVSSIEYLVVAGGGAGTGGAGGGGGGAGGFRSGTLSVSESIPITVGAGGTSGGSAPSPVSTSGENSVFGSIISVGGGYGAFYQMGGGYVAASGGSGGGSSQGESNGFGIAGQGYDGGDGNYSYSGSGGGGGGGAGGDASSVGGGSGGPGLLSSITGANLYYAGGGGGGGHMPGMTGGYGGIGGGGEGSQYSASAGTAGIANTGGGGGGGGGQNGIISVSGGNGGSGIVIIKYMLDSTAPVVAQVTAVSSPTSDDTPNYTFSSTEAGTITYGGDCSSSTTTASSGNNTITFNTLAEGVHNNCTIKVTDGASNESNVLAVNTFTIATNSVWYCEHYYNSSNVLQTGKNGQLDFTFVYGDENASATLSGYRIAIDTENLSLANIDSQADIISPSASTWNAGGSAAPGATITYSGTSVKTSPSAASYQIGYGTGSSVKTYYWWVKVRDSLGFESVWTPGPAFNTPKKHYPIVRVVANKENITTNTNIQYCSGTDLSNQSDPELRDACYSVCWTGTAGSAVVDPDNIDWKCSVCYNSSGTPVSCSTLNDGATVFTWKVPAGFVEDTDYVLVSGTLASANPIIKFLTAGTNLKMGLNITGSVCAAEQTGDIKKGLPSWKEVSPF